MAYRFDIVGVFDEDERCLLLSCRGDGHSDILSRLALLGEWLPGARAV